MPKFFDRDGYCRSCGYKRRRPADLSCRWPGRHDAVRAAPRPRPLPPNVPFDGDGYCRSCGYRRSRPADKSCEWPTKHDAGHDFPEQVIALYGSGMSMARVAAALGSDYNTVRKTLVDAGVQRRTLSQAWSPSSTAHFDRDDRCRSCGYLRARLPGAECGWSREHRREAQG